jgi:hypothetical protein
VRTLIRLAILGLAAYGAMALYEKLAPRKDELRNSGAQFFDRTSGAVREMGDKLGDAAHTLGETARDQAADVKATATEQAGSVRSAAESLSQTAR